MWVGAGEEWVSEEEDEDDRSFLVFMSNITVIIIKSMWIIVKYAVVNFSQGCAKSKEKKKVPTSQNL